LKNNKTLIKINKNNTKIKTKRRFKIQITIRTIVYLPAWKRKTKRKKNKKRLINDKLTTFGHHVPLQMKDEMMRNNIRR